MPKRNFQFRPRVAAVAASRSVLRTAYFSPYLIRGSMSG